MAFLLVCLILVLNAFFPGEVYEETGLLIYLLSGIMCFGLLFFRRDTGWLNHVSSGRFYLAAFLICLCFFSFLASLDRAAARDTMILFLSYILFLFVLVTLPFKKGETAFKLASLLAGLAAVIAIFGLYQHYYQLERTYRELTHALAFSQEMKEYGLRRLATGRIFSTFALPTTLAAFLAMVFPLNVSLFFHPRSSRFIKFLILCSGFLILLALYFTYSYSGVVMLAGAGFISLVLLRPISFSRRSVILALLVLIIGTFIGLKLIGFERGFDLLDLDASQDNPIKLRLLNYKGGIAIAGAYPYLGAGPGNFGTAYPRLMYPGSNETQYAHSTPIQFAAEMGIPAFCIALILFVFWFYDVTRRGRKMVQGEKNERAILLIGYYTAFLVFLLHNLGDIDFYFPGTAIPGLLIAGVCAGLVRKGEKVPSLLSGKVKMAAVAGMLICFLFFLPQAWFSYQGEKHYALSERAAHGGDFSAAAFEAERAADMDTLNYLYPAVRAWYLRRTAGDVRQEAVILSALEQARENNPHAAFVRAQLSESYLLQGKLLNAYLEAAESHRLYPLSETYQALEEQYSNMIAKEISGAAHEPK